MAGCHQGPAAGLCGGAWWARTAALGRGECQCCCRDGAAKCASGRAGGAFPRLHPDSAFSKSSGPGHTIPASPLCHGFTRDSEQIVSLCALMCPSTWLGEGRVDGRGPVDSGCLSAEAERA